MSSEILRLFEVNPWKVIENDFNPKTNEISESIFSMANEYMGARGMFEEGLSQKTLEGCYIGGMYVKERQSYAQCGLGMRHFDGLNIVFPGGNVQTVKKTDFFTNYEKYFGLLH